MVSFTGKGGKTEETKEPEAAPAKDGEKKEKPEEKKVFPNHDLLVCKKPRSQSLIPVYVRVKVQGYHYLDQVFFRLKHLSLCYNWAL